MIYPTIKATIHQGQVKFLDDVALPENSTILITVLDDGAFDAFPFTLGEQLTAGLENILSGQMVETTTADELTHHLNAVFSES